MTLAKDPFKLTIFALHPVCFIVDAALNGSSNNSLGMTEENLKKVIEAYDFDLKGKLKKKLKKLLQ